MMPTFDVTWLGYLMGGVALYYFALFMLSAKPLRRGSRPVLGWAPFMVLVIPAHNEELVIEETLAALTRSRYDDFLVLVMDDGSTDATAERARAFEGGGRVLVVERPGSSLDAGRVPCSITASTSCASFSGTRTCG